jgi:hypothetical protein
MEGRWRYSLLSGGGEGDLARAISFAVWTRNARVATGWPYRGESEEGGECGVDDKRVERRGE